MTARLNVLGTLLTFLAATGLFFVRPDPGPFLIVDDVNIVFGGAQDNGSSGRRTSLQWGLTFASGDGFMNAVDPTTPSRVFQTTRFGACVSSPVRLVEWKKSARWLH